MKDIREMFNISYFDNKELSLKEHCDIYSNIRKDLISILNKYDIKYVVADTESIRDLSKENQLLKKQLEEINKFKFSYRKDETKIPPIIRKQKDVEIIKNLENQQKEFIKWLEDEIKRINPKDLDIGELNLRLNDIKFTQYLIYKEILQKYRSIIGCDKVE